MSFEVFVLLRGIRFKRCVKNLLYRIEEFFIILIKLIEIVGIFVIISCLSVFVRLILIFFKLKMIVLFFKCVIVIEVLVFFFGIILIRF